MIPGIVGKAIRGSYRNMVVKGVVMLLVVAGVGWVMRETVQDYFRGPRVVAADEVGRIEDLDKVERKYVHVRMQNDNLVKERVWEKNVKSGIVTKYYVPVWVGKGWVLTDTETGDVPAEFDADLEPLSSWDDAHVVKWLSPGVRNNLLPVTMYRSRVKMKVLALAVGGGLAALIYLWKMFWAMFYLLMPGMHPAARAMKRFGKLREVANAVDEEMRGEGTGYELVRLSEHWLLYTGAFQVELIPLEDVVWAYKRVLRTYVKFVRVNTQVWVVVGDRFGVKHHLKMHESEVSVALAEVHRAVPWAVIGYEGRAARKWFWNKREFLAVVQNRKKGYLEKIRAGAERPRVEEETPRLMIRRKPEGSGARTFLGGVGNNA